MASATTVRSLSASRCGGTIEVLVEPVGPIHERAAAAVLGGTGVVLARIISPEDPPAPSACGPAIRGGDLWGPDLAPLGRDALDALREGHSRIATGLRLADGRMRACSSTPFPPGQLAIVGATDVAMALVHFISFSATEASL